MATGAQITASATWFISGLPEDADEMALMKHIEHIDKNIKIKRVTVLRSHPSTKSRGVAIVDFDTAEDGDKAFTLVNYTELSGSELQMVAYRPGGLKDLVQGNVFVKNLPSKLRSKELYEAFKDYGHIISCKAKYNASGLCKGYGYVQYGTKAEADKAIAEGNGKIIEGNKIEVCLFKPRKDRNSSITMYNNLFVKSIPRDYTSEQLKNLFAPYGEIISAVVIKDREDAPENRGFGFVCFRKTEDAKKAEEKLNNFLLQGQNLYVSRALTKEEHKKQMREERYRIFKDCNVYVKNLPDEVNDETLKKNFDPFGKILSARVMLEQRQDLTTGKIEYKSKNFGFVCFANKEDAKKAVIGASTQPIFGRMIYAAIAAKKEERAESFKRGFIPPIPMQWMQQQMYREPKFRRGGPDNRRMRPRPPAPMYPPYMYPMMGPGMVGMPPPMPGASYPPYAQQRVDQPPTLPNDKEALGEILYPMVERKDEKNAAKITGMLLEMEIPQIHNIIQSSAQLDRWISEALNVLNTTPSS